MKNTTLKLLQFAKRLHLKALEREVQRADAQIESTHNKIAGAREVVQRLEYAVDRLALRADEQTIKFCKAQDEYRAFKETM